MTGSHAQAADRPQLGNDIAFDMPGAELHADWDAAGGSPKLGM
jgi:hypothetical protein